MDYFHYRYQCPYLTSTDAKKVFCTDSCRVCFQTVGEGKRWLKRYCANTTGWRTCSIAKQKLSYQRRKEELQEEIKQWKTENQKG